MYFITNDTYCTLIIIIIIIIIIIKKNSLTL
jgi:hypothetical protein